MNIPIVFATNDRYAPYCGVAITSLICNASADKKYEIYVLYAELSAKNRLRICSLSTSNVSIEFIDVSGLLKSEKIDDSIRQHHLTVDTTYRLLIPLVLPQYKHVLYLDCDLILNDDAARLYESLITDFSDDSILFAARERLHAGNVSDITGCGASPEGYFNAGVLLINCEIFERENVRSRCLDLLSDSKKYKMLDQDVLNITCQCGCQYFDDDWNFTWERLITNYDLLDGAEYGRCDNVPSVIHYSTSIKPWNHPSLPLAEYFWNYARGTVFYEEIVLWSC